MLSGKLGDGFHTNAEKLLDNTLNRSQTITYGMAGFGAVGLGFMALLGKTKCSTFFFGFVGGLILILGSIPGVSYVTGVSISTISTPSRGVTGDFEQIASTNKKSFVKFVWSWFFPLGDPKQIASTNKQLFNWLWIVFFSEDIQSNLVDLWSRWVTKRGRLYACFKMCLYLPQVASLSSILQAFKRKRS